MTSPERLRRRQRIEGTALLALGIFTIILGLYFRGQDNQQRQCMASFMAQTSQTSAIRGQGLERESQATRDVIRAALTASTRHDLIVARQRYFASLKRIDQLRDENPVEQFNREACGG